MRTRGGAKYSLVRREQHREKKLIWVCVPYLFCLHTGPILYSLLLETRVGRSAFFRDDPTVHSRPSMDIGSIASSSSCTTFVCPTAISVISRTGCVCCQDSSGKKSDANTQTRGVRVDYMGVICLGTAIERSIILVPGGREHGHAGDTRMDAQCVILLDNTHS